MYAHDEAATPRGRSPWWAALAVIVMIPSSWIVFQGLSALHTLYEIWSLFH